MDTQSSVRNHTKPSDKWNSGKQHKEKCEIIYIYVYQLQTKAKMSPNLVEQRSGKNTDWYPNIAREASDFKSPWTEYWAEKQVYQIFTAHTSTARSPLHTTPKQNHDRYLGQAKRDWDNNGWPSKGQHTTTLKQKHNTVSFLKPQMSQSTG